jgi:hypothetical protein
MPDGKYRGPGGPDQKLTRVEREQQLHAMAGSQDGCGIILALWKEAKGIPLGTCPPVGTLVRQEMIPEILVYEYPNG